MTTHSDTAHLEQLRATVRTFLKNNLPDKIRNKTAAGVELKGHEYREWMGILSRQGWIAVNWTVQDGGTGWSLWERSVYEEEYYRANAPRIVEVGVRMVGPVILAYGSDAQRKRFLPKILDSSELWCQGYSELGAGSDLSSLQTKAVRDGDVYRVQGSKIWTSYAHFADRMFTLVRTSDKGKKREGISVLLIDMKSPGIRVRPILRMDGRHEFNEVFLDDVKVPVADRIGEEGEGWKLANHLLGHERGNMSHIMMIEEMLDTLTEISASESAGATTVSESTDFRRALAKIEIEHMAVRVTAEKIMQEVTADRSVGKLASVVKLGRNRSTQDVAQLMFKAGGYSAVPADPMAIRGDGPLPDPKYLFRMAPEYFDSRKSSIAGGTEEIQKDLIARKILGL
jgi:alkylation response protein AidB-like acyl-CoA dehydrogenase